MTSEAYNLHKLEKNLYDIILENMINRYQYKDTVWVDLIEPTLEESEEIMNEFNIDPIVAKELTSPSFKSRAELRSDFIYLILHFPAFKHSHKQEELAQEIDFVIGKDFLITARYDTIDAVDKFAKTIEVNSILNKTIEKNCTGFLFFGIVQEIYRSLSNELDYIRDWLGKIEKDIFRGKEKEMVVSLSHASRTLLNFKKTTDFHKEVLESLDEIGKKIFDEHFSYHVHRLLDEYHKLKYVIRNSMDSVMEMRETNNSLVSTKQNEIMKTLTILAFVTFPLTLVASIFSLNTSFIPLVGKENDFWIVIGIMVALTFFFFAYFKYKKWL